MIRTLICIFSLFLMIWGIRFLHKRMPQRKYQLLLKVLFAGYMLFCLYITLLNRTTKDFHPITLVPLSTFMRIGGFPVESWRDLQMIMDGARALGKPHLSGIGGMIQNIILFVPFGFLLRGGWARARIKRIILLGLFCSLSIEMIQLIGRIGWFDVDDILFNTLGVYLGVRLHAYALGGQGR